MIDLGRIQKELKEIERDKVSGVTVQLQGNSLQRLIGYVEGPRDTPYEGGLFQIDISLEDSYPFVPPKMKFVSKVRLQTGESGGAVSVSAWCGPLSVRAPGDVWHGCQIGHGPWASDKPRGCSNTTTTSRHQCLRQTCREREARVSWVRSFK